MSQFLTLLQLKKAVAAGQDLLDPIGVQAVASALNKHVGIIFKGEMWSTHEDVNFWSCDIQLAAVQEALGKLRCMPVKMLRRSARTLGTVALVKEEIKIEVDPVEEPVLTSHQCQHAHDYVHELLRRGPRYPPPTAAVGRPPSDDEDQEVAAILEAPSAPTSHHGSHALSPEASFGVTTWARSACAQSSQSSKSSLSQRSYMSQQVLLSSLEH